MAGGEAKPSDLRTRSLSALAMVAVAATALWLGGMVWALFVAAVATGVYWEWAGLVRGFATQAGERLRWMIGGFVYIAIAAGALLGWRLGEFGISRTILVVAIVIAIDIGAYFAGRTFGGPKIAPRISPSKTWAGLVGGSLGAALVVGGWFYWMACYDPALRHCEFEDWSRHLRLALLGGVLAAIVAQAGDFFESWMKRRAGVKDSGHLIPGHGGLFDRVDGLLAVNFLLGLFAIAVILGRLSGGATLLPSPA